MINAILENRFLDTLTSCLRRSPDQINRQHESDAEIIRVPGRPGVMLALTTDSIVEEISSGLYDDPYIIGWMTVMVNLSDLAAVGARPAGILVSEVLPRAWAGDHLRRLQDGIDDACRECGTFVLGGDTNFSDRLMLTGCALGTFQNGSFTTRAGCKPGDVAYLTHPAGQGNAMAAARFLAAPGMRFPYLPVARLKEGHLLAGIATACMDTSDGVLATLDQLMRINSCGFDLDAEVNAILDPEAVGIAHATRIPAWLLLAGHHGEFELVFTVPEERREEFGANAKALDWQPVRLGRVSERVGISLPLYGRKVSIDTAWIRNLAVITMDEIETYITRLLEYDTSIQNAEACNVSGR